MPASKEEKYLASIDGTLKDILKELKRQGRTEIFNIDGREVAKAALDMSIKENRLRGYGDNRI